MTLSCHLILTTLCVLLSCTLISTNFMSSEGVAASQPSIQYESYNALLGDSIRLKCPQANPTWFFRRSATEFDVLPSSAPREDLIVTRHGIINADYKHKILCHITYKHQIIIINKVGFDEEGLYTCLYTQAPPHVPEKSYYATNEVTETETSATNLIQYRYVFNVTVYSK